MPILDLQQDAGARLKRAGIIRLGVKKKSQRTGKEYPAETPHFVLKDAPGLVEIYGNEPRRLNIYLPFNEVDRNLIAWHQHWVAGGLLCRGDGERIEYAVDPGTGEVIVKKGQALATGTFDGVKTTTGHPVKCSGMDHGLYPRCQQCRPNALLIVLIREVPRLAYYQIATSSIHNVVNLTGQMRWVKENIGRLQGVPFILERRRDKISTPGGNGKRVRREKYLLHLEPDPNWVKEMLAEMHRRALPGAGRAVAAIPAGVEDVEIVTEVTDLDDEPLWEPVETYDDERDEDAENEYGRDHPAPTSLNGNGCPLPPAGEITADVVAQAAAVTVRTRRGNMALGEMDGEEFDKTVAWLQNGNVEKHADVAQAVAVLLAEQDRVTVNRAAWQGVELPEGVLPSLFEDEEHAIGALARSWAVGFDSPPEIVLTWSRHFRSAVDVGDGDVEAAAFADRKMQVEALEEFVAETGAEVSELDE
jgi:hypothetical protein